MIHPLSILVIVFTCTAGAMSQSLALAHEGEKTPIAPQGTVLPSDEQDRLIAINQVYLQEIKPIFAAKCFDCHSSQTKFPWYYKVLGVKQFIDHDISEAREHLDMSQDFPFRGHSGDFKQDLKMIREEVEEGEMPPFLYRLMHSSSKISVEEKQKILKWVDESLR